MLLKEGPGGGGCSPAWMFPLLDTSHGPANTVSRTNVIRTFLMSSLGCSCDCGIGLWTVVFGLFYVH